MTTTPKARVAALGLLIALATTACANGASQSHRQIASLLRGRR